MAEFDCSAAASQWREAHEHWKKINISGQMGSWDEMYGLIVASKENSIGEKQRLVGTVKEFVTAYKTDPSQERVDAVLKFFRKYIGQLLERCEVAEKGFLAFYHTFSLVTDPAELFLAAHAELMHQQRSLAELNSAYLGLKLDNERLIASRANAEAALSDLQENGDAPSALKQQLASLQDTLAEMQGEKKLLAQMLRTGELQAEKLKGDVARLSAANSSLQDALSASTAKVDEVVLRAERESARLLDDIEEGSRQAELLREELERLKNRSQQPEAPSHLSTELAAMHQLCARLESSCSEAQKALEAEKRSSALLAAELAQAKAATSRLMVERDFSTSLASSADSVATAAAAAADAAESRRRVRELERELLSQRLALAEARESLQTAGTTVETLRRELAVLSATPAGLVMEENDWATAFGGTSRLAESKSGTLGLPAKATAGSGLLSESDFAELLADDGKTGMGADAEGTNDGEDADPAGRYFQKAPSAPLVAGLLAQRGVLKKRLTQAEQQLASTRVEFQKARAKCEQLLADNALLLKRVQASDGNGDGFLGEHQVQLLLQDKRAVGGRLDAGSGTAVVTVGGAPARQPRRAAVSQKLFSVVDHVAVVIANMLVFNKFTRAFLVCYVLSLHLVVFVVLYVSSGKYMGRRVVMPVATAAPSLDGW